jgi:hypothetical protein
MFSIHYTPPESFSSKYAEEGFTEESYNEAMQEGRDSILALVREYRDKKLLESDWTQTATHLSEEKKAAWATYRQELRDFPSTLDFTAEIKITQDNLPSEPN